MLIERERRGLGSFEEIHAYILEEGAKREAKIAEARKKLRVFLLGPGDPPSEKERRLKLERSLEDIGIKAIVMGLLTGILGLDTLLAHLRYCVEVGTDEKASMTVYVKEQLPMTKTVHFQGDDGLLRAVTNFVDNYIMGSGLA